MHDWKYRQVKKADARGGKGKENTTWESKNWCQGTEKNPNVCFPGVCSINLSQSHVPRQSRCRRLLSQLTIGALAVRSMIGHEVKGVHVYIVHRPNSPSPQDRRNVHFPTNVFLDLFCGCIVSCDGILFPILSFVLFHFYFYFIFILCSEYLLLCPRSILPYFSFPPHTFSAGLAKLYPTDGQIVSKLMASHMPYSPLLFYIVE